MSVHHNYDRSYNCAILTFWYSLSLLPVSLLYSIQIRQTYETTMSEWLAVEAIVRQRDKEIMAMNMAKLSSESQNGEIPLVGRDRSLSNEVRVIDLTGAGLRHNDAYESEGVLVLVLVGKRLAKI